MPTTARLYSLESISKPRPLRTVKPPARVVSAVRATVQTATFSPLEEDFFARAADLYPRPGDEVEEWDQLFATIRAGL